MKEIHLGRILSENRRRKGITQDELAEFMGVSKAAVSKWETESTYPDILLLPRLAAYFDMSIDELMGYEPQMDKREIRETHRRLSEEFTTLPFEEALEHCREYAREYYSCYPLVFQIGSLLVNHFMLAQSAEAGEQILGEASELFRRVKEGTDDPGLGKEALHMEAYCLLLLRRPEEVLELLKEKTPVTSAPEPLLASAWKQTGDRREARRVLQIGIYREVIALLNLLTSYMELCREEPGKYRETCRRLTAAADAFDMDQLHPGIMMPCYIDMAQGWAALGEVEPGEVFGFLGPNGAGKTTTVKLLNGMLTPTEGTCRVLGADPAREPEKVHAAAGVATEHARMYDNLTGLQNLVFYAEIFGIPAEEAGRRAAALLGKMELEDAKDRKLAAWSTGMRQRLSLARALIHRPKVLFLDEPTSGLDPESAQNVNRMIREMAENSGITVFLCTHQLRYAQEICTRYGLIEEGSLLASGTLEELREEAFSEITLQIRADKMPPGMGFKKTGAQEYETAVRSEKEIPEIVRRIAAAGGDIYGVEAKEPDLEDIYFALTALGREGL